MQAVGETGGSKEAVVHTFEELSTESGQNPEESRRKHRNNTYLVVNEGEDWQVSSFG